MIYDVISVTISLGRKGPQRELPSTIVLMDTRLIDQINQSRFTEVDLVIFWWILIDYSCYVESFSMGSKKNGICTSFVNTLEYMK